MLSRAFCGVIIAHMVVILVFFIGGAFIGCEKMNMFQGKGPIEFGLRGGLNAIGLLLILYVASLGIAPLIVAVIGAALALLTRWISGRFSKNSTGQTPLA